MQTLHFTLPASAYAPPALEMLQLSIYSLAFVKQLRERGRKGPG